MPRDLYIEPLARHVHMHSELESSTTARSNLFPNYRRELRQLAAPAAPEVVNNFSYSCVWELFLHIRGADSTHVR
jgi:hypothetical protein